MGVSESCDKEAAVRYRAHQCTWRVIPGYFVAANIDGVRTEVEGTGGEIWELLMEGLSVGSVVTELADRYSTSYEEIQPDVEWFVAQMTERGLVVRADS